MTISQPGGKYDAEASELLERLDSAGVAVIVIGGSKGHGFQVAINAEKQDPHEVTQGLVKVLRNVADQMERDMGKEEAKA